MTASHASSIQEAWTLPRPTGPITPALRSLRNAGTAKPLRPCLSSTRPLLDSFVEQRSAMPCPEDGKRDLYSRALPICHIQ